MSSEETRVLYGFEKIIETIDRALHKTRNRWDGCVDADIPSISMGELREAYHDAKQRGVKIRYITEITRDNLQYCNEITKVAELRHFAGLKGSFAVSDDEYVAGIKDDSTNRLSHCIYSNVKQMVRHQKIVFDALWQNAVPAEARIREIREGIIPSVMEVIQRSQDSLERVYARVKSADKEVLIMFSTPNAMRRQLRMGGAQVLREAASRGAKIRILVPGDGQILDAIKGMKSTIPQLEVRSIEKSLRTRITIVIVDRKESFIFETKDDDAEDAYSAVGQSLYSNNEATTRSFASIFESFWNQAELYEKLKELGDMKEEFVGIAAHELRNPALPIILAAEELAEELGPANSKLRIIIRNAKRLNRLAGTILDITRIEGKTFRLQKERTNITRLVEGAMQDAATTMQEDKSRLVQMHRDISPNIEQDIVLDKERIRQVLANLLDNAIKFTEHGTITVAVSKSKEYPGHLEVRIADTGRGIDESIMDRLFEKFVTKSEKLKGTGLGLYLSKAIVEAHGGKIWAMNNKDGRGATLTFTIPYQG